MKIFSFFVIYVIAFSFTFVFVFVFAFSFAIRTNPITHKDLTSTLKWNMRSSFTIDHSSVCLIIQSDG